MPRYTRDEILVQGLELASSPTVTQHDMPGGIIQPNAYCIKWLQNALDMFHRKYPFSSRISTASITIQANSYDAVLSSNTSLYVPTDFILDVRNGIDVSFNNTTYSLKRKSFQYFRIFTQQYNTNSTTTRPFIYTVIQERLKVAPLLTTGTTGTLWYYALADELSPVSYPDFPDEWTLIEFVRLKALEWTRSIDVGTAQAYMTKQLAGLRSSGLLNQAEYEDDIPLENNQVLLNGEYVDRNSWMGGFGST